MHRICMLKKVYEIVAIKVNVKKTKGKPGPKPGTPRHVLSSEQKLFCITCAARYMGPAEIVRAVKDRFGIEMSMTAATRYDLDTEVMGKNLSAERLKVLNQAKVELRKVFHREPAPQ